MLTFLATDASSRKWHYTIYFGESTLIDSGNEKLTARCDKLLAVGCQRWIVMDARQLPADTCWRHSVQKHGAVILDRRHTSVGSMLDQRLWRWPDFYPAFSQENACTNTTDEFLHSIIFHDSDCLDLHCEISQQTSLRWTNVGSMLVHCLRRSTSIEPTLIQRILLTEIDL